MAVLPEHAQEFYYRTSNGAEIDLVLAFGSKDLWAIEIKRSASATLSRGFHEACGDIKPSRKFVVHGEADSFPMKDDVQSISLYGLMRQLMDMA